jgi:hypothetical protein
MPRMRLNRRLPRRAPGPRRDLSDVVKGGDGAKSEAAIQNSPGLQPWVTRCTRSALKVATEVHLLALQRVVPIARPKIGCHFQGTSHRPPNPGLKPWSVLYSHSAPKSDKPVRTESKNDFALMGRSVL